jgi:hypothetical protein
MIFNLSYSNKSNANLVYVSLKTYRGATLQNKIIMIIIFYNNNDYRHTICILVISRVVFYGGLEQWKTILLRIAIINVNLLRLYLLKVYSPNKCRSFKISTHLLCTTKNNKVNKKQMSTILAIFLLAINIQYAYILSEK